jgi:hypothetical protein
MYTLRFSDVDLEANRQGYLSDAQRKRLDADVDMLRQQSKYVVWFFAAFAVFILVVGGISEFNNAGRDMDKFLSPSNIQGFAIMIVMFSGIMIVASLWSWWTTRRYEQGTIRTVEGRAEVVRGDMTLRGIRTSIYNVKIRRGIFSRFIFRFQDSDSLDHFKHGKHYRVYYIPYAIPQALSCEEVYDEKDKR